MCIALAAVTISVQAQGPNRSSRNEKKALRKEERAEKIALKALNGGNVSYQAKQQFFTDFGDPRDVQWTRTDYFDQATFTDKDNRKKTAYYDDEAKLVGTTMRTSFEELPLSAQHEIARHYQHYEDAPVIFYDDNEFNETDMLLYGTQFDDEDNYFIELKDKKDRPVVLKVSMEGNVSFFANIK